MTKALVPTAKEINEAHQFAKDHAATAVDWAVKCGQLLTAKKASLKHGEWQDWVRLYCEFGLSTAKLYMKAGEQNANALAFSAVRHLFPGNDPQREKPAKAPAPVTIDAKQPDWQKPAQPAPVAKPESAKPVEAPAPEPEDDSDEQEELALFQKAEAEYTDSIERVMSSDDRLAAAHAEIKRQAAEIAALKISRDGLQNRCGELVRMLKKEQALVAKLKKAAA